MMYDLARTERQHLANNKGPEYSLVRKRCACGKASTSRQLSQYGRCVTCVRSVPPRPIETCFKEEN